MRCTFCLQKPKPTWTVPTSLNSWAQLQWRLQRLLHGLHQRVFRGWPIVLLTWMSAPSGSLLSDRLVITCIRLPLTRLLCQSCSGEPGAGHLLAGPLHLLHHPHPCEFPCRKRIACRVCHSCTCIAATMQQPCLLACLQHSSRSSLDGEKLYPCCIAMYSFLTELACMLAAAERHRGHDRRPGPAGAH